MRLVLPSLVLISAALAGCQSTRALESPTAHADFALDEIRPGVWIHTTTREVEGFGPVRSNGLAVAGPGGAVLIDTGWTDDPDAVTAEIVGAVERAAGVPVRRAVLSHHHDDSVGGIGALRAAGIPTVARAFTADLMAREGWPRPDSVLTDGEAWTLGPVEVFFAGPGHTLDNVVVWVPGARVLYGGCLIRPGGSRSAGNTADADVARWAETVARVRDRYGDRVEVVVPSHGPPGGPELLDHTIAVIEAHRGRPVGG